MNYYMNLLFRFFCKYKVQPLEYPVYELDCKKHNGIYLQTRSEFKTSSSGLTPYLLPLRHPQ